MTLRVTLVLLWSLSSSTLVATASPARAGPRPFEQGSMRFSLLGGGSSYASARYVVLGAGFGYFVVDGLEVGLGIDQWLGGDYWITKVSPQLRYVVHVVPTVTPYAGVFYNRWLISGGQEDRHTVGGRAGVFYAVSGSRAHIAMGAAAERVLGGCTGDCGRFHAYPEISLYVGF